MKGSHTSAPLAAAPDEDASGRGLASPRRALQEERRVLSPPERLSEILFGLIMALTFTAAVHAAEADRETLRTMLYGAVGCNLAWGIVDAAMYLMGGLVERNRGRVLLEALRDARSEEEAHALIASVLPEGVAQAMTPVELEAVRRRLLARPLPPARARVTSSELRGALGVFLLVTLSTFPLVLPFLLVSEPVLALRTSHGVGLAMLFLVGSAYGRYSGQRPLVSGLALVAIGLVLVALAIALGG